MAHADLADYIETRKEEITSTWIEAVRQEPRIQSDINLSETGLRDHIPSVIAEICDLTSLKRNPNNPQHQGSPRPRLRPVSSGVSRARDCARVVAAQADIA